ncbi:MAG: sigma factor-like helix-turn-helix DNA-binding protein [Planctomycetota bacterium]
MATQESAVLARYGTGLQRCLERLGARARRLIDGMYRQDLPQERLAEREGMSHAAVRQALSRARAWLRRCIEEQGHGY